VEESRSEEIGALRAAIARATARADSKLVVLVISSTGTIPSRMDVTHTDLWILYLSTSRLKAGPTAYPPTICRAATRPTSPADMPIVFFMYSTKNGDEMLVAKQMRKYPSRSLTMGMSPVLPGE